MTMDQGGRVSELAGRIREEATRETALRIGAALSDARAVFATQFGRLTPMQRDQIITAAIKTPGVVPESAIDAVERELIDRMVKHSRLAEPAHGPIAGA